MTLTARRAWHTVSVFYGRARGRSYVEDFVRVYPDGYVYYPFGLRRRQGRPAHENFINHRRFYEFCAQFVAGKAVYDIGCGSGHGFEVLAAGKPRELAGCDLSRHAVAYARRRFGALAVISRQDASQLEYRDDVADVTICSEVLEHVKDYGREQDLLTGLCRITRPGGLFVVATPNIDASPGHGFSEHELRTLIARNFDDAFMFENGVWVERPAERLAVGPYTVDTERLHNTHSFVVIAVNR